MAETATIRLGKISSINYSAGKARVTYEDRDQAVTKELPFLAWQYNMPKVSDLVVVACFSNGTASGVILGPIYNTANAPYSGASGIFRQEMAASKNTAVLSYDAEAKTATLRAPYLELEGYSYSGAPKISISDINSDIADMVTVKSQISDLQSADESLESKIAALEKRVEALEGGS